MSENKGDEEMAGHESVFKGINIGKYTDEHQKLSSDLRKYVKGDITFLCVGTDRSTGDSFAPFVGTFLKEKGYENVIGTIDDPVHAENLDERIQEIPEGSTVLAIDGCLGRLKSVGSLTLNSGSLYPGVGVGKNLTPVGDYHINGVVNVSSEDRMLNFRILGCTKLSLVLKLAKQCVAAIEDAFPIHNEKFESAPLFFKEIK